MDIAE